MFDLLVFRVGFVLILVGFGLVVCVVIFERLRAWSFVC